jgi:hypothetical protein
MSGVFRNINHPLTARRVCTIPPPPLVLGEDTLAGWRGGGAIEVIDMLIRFEV